MTVEILQGDCREVLKRLPDRSVNCVVTSPPYFNLRDYQVEGQIGLEASPEIFVAELVAVFREVRRVLRDDGTVWLNLGDSCAGSWGAQGRDGEMANRSIIHARQIAAHSKKLTRTGSIPEGSSLKQKDLIGVPWAVAFALRAAGWFLRQDIVWSKPNPMPESVRDRCTKAHEYIFLLSKSEQYYFDGEAIKEPVASSTLARLSQPTLGQQVGSTRVPGKTNGNMKAVGSTEKRNKRSVWTVTTKPFKGAHFATFPPDLIEPCVLAGCPVGGTVLDPFFGAGTTGIVADRLGRNCLGIELNPEYVEMARRRLAGDPFEAADAVEGSPPTVPALADIQRDLFVGAP